MSIFRSKRVLVPAAVLAAVAVGAGTWTATAQANDVHGSERDQVAAAVAETVADGRVTEVETSDDRGEAYDVEVVLPDGTELDLALDQDLAVVSREDDRDDNDDRDDRDGQDTDDRVLSSTETERAEQAALEAVGGGTVTDVEASDDHGTAYDVEVVDAEGVEWDIDLDDAFDVLDQRQDR